MVGLGKENIPDYHIDDSEPAECQRHGVILPPHPTREGSQIRADTIRSDCHPEHASTNADAENSRNNSFYQFNRKLMFNTECSRSGPGALKKPKDAQPESAAMIG